MLTVIYYVSKQKTVKALDIIRLFSNVLSEEISKKSQIELMFATSEIKLIFEIICPNPDYFSQQNRPKVSD